MTPHRRQRRRWRRPPQQMWPGETQRSWARQDPRPGWAGGVDRFEMCARSIESVEYVVSCASVRDESDLINYHSRTHDRTHSSHRGSTSPHVRAFHTVDALTIHSNTCSQPLPVAECPCVPTRRTRPYNPTSQSRMPSASPPLPLTFPSKSHALPSFRPTRCPIQRTPRCHPDTSPGTRARPRPSRSYQSCARRAGR